ncbi:pyridoxal 5'-phosphate synthase glutaminase subunit PdxT [Clostridiaceae bacterium UIB06]|uniref:Pyridoxal 5'-phosphate synthase subunit PdxT n=1 Tax=Clostridium thailandense TaxID=2794346 RepID=A0A949TTJ7_9CLOT|nr:pyridoxal 5'-phosphate synthase glutaminase subunit PdxT [Clostridium thailandense]MBV7273131.1 pyridoxal 5'-phosphate synthase glutaminase subunit PdxT [Clostridium thailandense]MCH5137543.1 pyridoxal 5'-phosphate synthase glutaminase subunit PdxT [Clostridiaceae bacterium UIB06]
MKIGVLSIQGGVIEHIKHIESLGAEAVEIKNIEDLQDIDGLILPGGESTAIGKILKERNLLKPIREKILSGLGVWGTCAGMILLAEKIENENNTYFSVMDIKVRRNAYGSQIDSFEQEAVIDEISKESIPLVFIRAPYITEVGPEVEVLCELNGNIVAAKKDKILVTSFHPELTENLSFHKYFLSMCNNQGELQ